MCEVLGDIYGTAFSFGYIEFLLSVMFARRVRGHTKDTSRHMY